MRYKKKKPYHYGYLLNRHVSSATFPSANLVINDSFIKRWEENEGFIGLKDYATRVDDKELEMKIRIVEKFKERIPELVQKIESSHVLQEAMAGKAKLCHKETSSSLFSAQLQC